MCGHDNDPFVTYLKSFGYSPLRLPKSNIRPLQLLALQGSDLDWVGDLTDVFDARVALPAIEADNVASSIQGQRTGELNIGLGLSLLGNIIGALSGSKMGIDVQYKQARTASFSFPEVFEDRVSVALLDQFLTQADINPNSRGIEKLLDADQVFITTSTIKSKKFNVEAKSDRGTTVQVDVPVVQELVGGSIRVSQASSAAGTVTYDGLTPLVFGFQAVRLFFDNGQYTSFKPLDAGKHAAKALESQVPLDGAERYLPTGAFASLRMPGA